MTGKRELMERHRPYMTHSPAAVHCTGCTLVFGSWEKFGKHVDDLLAQPPHSREDAVEDVLAGHLGGFDFDNQLDPYIGGGRVSGTLAPEPERPGWYLTRTGDMLSKDEDGFWHCHGLDGDTSMADGDDAMMSWLIVVSTFDHDDFPLVELDIDGILHAPADTAGEDGLLRRVIDKCQREALFWQNRCLEYPELKDLGVVSTAKQDVYEAICLYCENLLDETALEAVE